MAAAWEDAARVEVGRQKVVDDGLVVRNLAFLTAPLENLLEVLARRILGEYFVVDTAEERFIDQVSWSQVRCEHNQEDEWDRQLLTRFERQVIDPAFERRNPAVEQIDGRALLPAE